MTETERLAQIAHARECIALCDREMTAEEKAAAASILAAVQPRKPLDAQTEFDLVNKAFSE